MNKPLAYTYFIAGIIFCISIYLILQRSASSLFVRLSLIIGYLLVFLFWRWIESRLHNHYLQLWKRIRLSGKFTFILTRYILLRGIILSAIFLVPSYSQIDTYTGLLFIVLIIFITTTLGNQEWVDCETKYQADLLHDAATSLRVMQN